MNTYEYALALEGMIALGLWAHQIEPDWNKLPVKFDPGKIQVALDMFKEDDAFVKWSLAVTFGTDPHSDISTEALREVAANLLPGDIPRFVQALNKAAPDRFLAANDSRSSLRSAVTAMPEGNYRTALLWLIDQGHLTHGGGRMRQLGIGHDDWCPHDQGQPCCCAPEFYDDGKRLFYPLDILPYQRDEPDAPPAG